MKDQNFWDQVNAELVAKAIGELVYEEVLRPSLQSDGFELRTESGAVYEFEGHLTVWSYLRVRPGSMKRHGTEKISAARFFFDIQAETGMNDITLGNFLEEMHNTLLGDMELKRRGHGLKVAELALWDGEKLQSLLSGHPKILLNKGRIGWSARDFREYSPESGATFQLFWIAVRKELVSVDDQLLRESFSESALVELKRLILQRDLNEELYHVIPVHPWQWDRYVEIQFAREIHEGSIVALGEAGDFYRPQASIRTLSNDSRPERMDVKLPLTILNTSCYRGLPAAYLSLGGELAQTLERVCGEDEKLKNVRILKEASGWSFPHEGYTGIKNAPYRYHEMLGGVWRESAQSKLASGEKAILSAALFHQDSEGRSLLGEYARLSGIPLKEWIKSLFEAILPPLCHLQFHYGVGLVAHGQNIVLILKDHVPSGIIIKDFHGDLRLSSKLPPEGLRHFGKFSQDLTKLPPEHLIHDFITGQLVTVQRFISAVVLESEGLPEEAYYSLMAQSLSEYPVLLRPEFERILLNKVRFRIGYADSAERPLPQLGSPLKNPLSLSMEGEA